MRTPKTTIDIDTLRLGAGRAVGALKLLANEDRLLLLCQLSLGEMCVGDLEERLDIRQPTLSQQLGVLRSEGVVATRRDGKNIFYSVADPALLEVLAVLYRLYCPKEP
jgi:DNA-binding transcriptional ArsR family regulator